MKPRNYTEENIRLSMYELGQRLEVVKVSVEGMICAGNSMMGFSISACLEIECVWHSQTDGARSKNWRGQAKAPVHSIPSGRYI